MTNDHTAGHSRQRPHVHVLTAAILATVGWTIGGCSTSTTPQSGSGGLGNGTIGTITKSANDSSFRTPFDATPSPDGSSVYFTAIASDGTGGVFQASASGGAVTRLDSGGALVSPFGITISEDGKDLFVADPANDDDTTDQYGAVLTLPAGGGVPSVLSGTQGLIPRGVVVSGQTLYFTGGATAKGPAGIYKTDVSGGAPTTIASGAPFVAPCGIAVTSGGDAYVVDAVGSTSRLASILLVHDGRATPYVADLGVGYPAGIALAQDESALLVSGLDPSAGTDLVYRVSPLGSSPQVASFNTVIGAFSEPAGLHRAANADIYAWADSRANSTGTVYTLGK
jgi:DNA-binding beta-propeller fold protein YncE